MRRTFTTRLPDQAGAFLEAGRVISRVGGNITRVSYNKAVDTHTLFLEVEGEEPQLAEIAGWLEEKGYLTGDRAPGQVILVECRVEDRPGGILPVLELIRQYRFNISYISSQEDGSGYQDFRLGLFIENPQEVTVFLKRAARLCPVRIVHYEGGEKNLDNTVFYLSFAYGIGEKLSLDREQTQELMVDANRIMQLLDHQGNPPYKTFEYISRFADSLVANRGERFNVRISQRALSLGTLILIEPPCGSNTYIVERGGKLLFVDSGFACYREEMLSLLRQLFEEFDGRERELALTHGDLDHCGLAPLFSRVHVGGKCYENFLLEQEGKPNFREQVPVQAPYCRIARVLTGYQSPSLETLQVIGSAPSHVPAGLTPIGKFSFEGLEFEAFEGSGGHVEGETVLVCQQERLVFTGDIFVNIKGFTKVQAAFNRLAPFLMSSVDTHPKMAAQERQALFALLRQRGGRWTVCGGHGAITDYPARPL